MTLKCIVICLLLTVLAFWVPNLTGMSHQLSVPDTDVEDWLQADISSTGKVLLILAHADGVQPLVHWVHAELWGSRVLPAEIQSALTIQISKEASHFQFIFIQGSASRRDIFNPATTAGRQIQCENKL